MHVCTGEDRVRSSDVSLFRHAARSLPSAPPQISGSGGGGDIWEQFWSAPAKVVKGLISSHAGAQKKTASSKN